MMFNRYLHKILLVLALVVPCVATVSLEASESSGMEEEGEEDKGFLSKMLSLGNTAPLIKQNKDQEKRINEQEAELKKLRALKLNADLVEEHQKEFSTLKTQADLVPGLQKQLKDLATFRQKAERAEVLEKEKKNLLDEKEKAILEKTKMDWHLFTEEVMTTVESKAAIELNKTVTTLETEKEAALSSLTNYKIGSIVIVLLTAGLFLDDKYGQKIVSKFYARVLKSCASLYDSWTGFSGVKFRNGIRRVVRPCLGIKETAPVCKHKRAAGLAKIR